MLPVLHETRLPIRSPQADGNLQPRTNRVLGKASPDLPAALQNVVEYRKSGLSLNHIVGCPLDCGYCVRHLFGNFDMKQPRLILDDADAVNTLVNNSTFRPHTTPIQLLNRATDLRDPLILQYEPNREQVLSR